MPNYAKTDQLEGVCNKLEQEIEDQEEGECEACKAQPKQKQKK